MTHPIYTAKHLLKKGISYCKQIAKELGINPEGDKRQLFTWVEAITQYQSTQLQEVELVEATIEYNDGLSSCQLETFNVVVNGEIVHSFPTYAAAEGWATRKGYTLVDSQTLAQQELEVEMEVQAATIEVLEQVEDDEFYKSLVQSGGDNHFSETECKHQIAVKEEIASRISFISPSDFGFYEAILDGDVNNVIATIDHESFRTWRVEMNGDKRMFISYQKAEEFIKDEYTKGVFMERGSGRITQPIEDMGMTIEDSNFVHDFGQSYTVRIYGILAGSIFLNDDHGWTLNGKDYQDEWRPIAKDLVRLTKHEYLVAA